MGVHVSLCGIQGFCAFSVFIYIQYRNVIVFQYNLSTLLYKFATSTRASLDLCQTCFSAALPPGRPFTGPESEQ